MLQGLADLIGISYLLSRRLGFDFARLDRTLIQRLQTWMKSDKADFEEQWSDLSLLLGYLAPED